MTSLKCANCGLVDWATAEICRRCGSELSVEVAKSETPGVASPVSLYDSHGNGDEAPMIQPFKGVGEILSGTFRIFTENFLLISKLVIVVVAPIGLLQYAAASKNHMNIGAVVTAGLLSLFASTIVAPALIYAIATVIQTGSAPTLNECYAVGLRRIFNVLLVALVTGLLIFGGLILLVIPGIILAMGYIVV